MRSTFETSLSLLERVRRGDEDAWAEFSVQCVSMLRHWCGKWGMQDADMDDLIQDTLLIVLGCVGEFRRRGTGSFRSWIRTIAWRCWCDAVSRAERSARPEVLAGLKESLLARQALEDEFDMLLETQMLEHAMTVVRERVHSSSWDAFRLMALEGLTGNAAAELAGLSLSAVHAARYRVQRLISAEIRRQKNCEELS
jgi:RNA polymerase sigma-70 factor (ECF subfamily)